MDQQAPTHLAPATVEPSVEAGVSDAGEHSDAREREPGPRIERRPELELTFVGDVVLGRYLEHRGDEVFVELYAPEADPFAAVAPLLAADVVIGNLESPVMFNLPARSPSTRVYRLAGSAAHMAQLQRGGFTAMSLANNHFFDLGVDGQLEGPQVLADAGLLPIGASRVEPPLLRVETLEVQGWRLGFLAFATLRNHWGEPDGPQLPFVTLGQIREQAPALVAAARAEHDLLIVVAHWGTEYASEVRNALRLTARTLVESGVDLVIGHHPHAPASSRPGCTRCTSPAPRAGTRSPPSADAASRSAGGSQSCPSPTARASSARRPARISWSPACALAKLINARAPKVMNY
ncbi:Capsule biosynthesis protein CapA [Enhygromyxa salina]|uniref:Capsule biosynthesis protein CapA n=1 Tax=Enhygromyxa salina TaxID=215803 RepID=A0A2S9YKV3_9BACT|nr:CapA family protein [Enhygromyxa salina]PRQ05747.1 Capsule biosynthesis protein CapA [Enhygromyxa salina]